MNSPAFSGGRQVDTLSRGVLVLGVKEISQLALGVTVLSKFKSPLAEPVGISHLKADLMISVCVDFA